MSKADRNKLLFGGEQAGAASFDHARVAFLPTPMELTVSYGGGTGDGPNAILAASERLEFFDEETGRPYWAPGEVHTLDAVEIPSDPGAAVDCIADAALETVNAGKFLFTLGGEHTVTAGAFRAVARAHDDVGMLVVDAHLDLRDEYQGSPWSHACVMRRILEEHGAAICWCGARSFSVEEADFVARRDLSVVPAHSIALRRSDDEWIDESLEGLPNKIYLSIDVDGR